MSLSSDGFDFLSLGQDKAIDNAAQVAVQLVQNFFGDFRLLVRFLVVGLGDLDWKRASLCRNRGERDRPR